MKREIKYLFLFCLFACSISWNSIHAQSSLNVFWEAPISSIKAKAELKILSDLGVDYVFVKHPFSRETLFELQNSEIKFIVDASVEFLLLPDLENLKEEIDSQLKNLLQEYNSLNLGGVLLIRNSATFQDDFLSIIQNFESFNDSTKVFYEYQSEIKAINFDNDLVFQVYNRTKFSNSDIHVFNEALNSEDLNLLVSNTFLQKGITNYPALGDALISYATSGDLIIPLPNSNLDEVGFNWPIFLLLILWLSFAINIVLHPAYKDGFVRYFTAHRFFVDDVMSYRERRLSNGIVLLFQHAFFGGLMVYATSRVYLSETGLEALYHLIPQLSLFGEHYFSLFVITSITIFLVEIIAVFWLYLPNPSMKHLSQVINLFTAPFHLDFIFGTLALTFLYAELPPIFILVLATLYLINWLASFFITAFDGAITIGEKRTSYLLKTAFLHALVNVAMIATLIYYDEWTEILELIIQL